MIAMTKHAKDRCDEMGLDHSIPGRIYATQSISYPGSRNAAGAPSKVFRSSEYPDYFIVTDEAETVVVTIAFNTPGVKHVRNGTTYEVKEETA